MRIFSLILYYTISLYSQNAWEILNPLPQEKTVNCVQIVNDSLVYAAGENGAFLRSFDYGKTWFRNPVGSAVSVMSLFFTDELNGWLGTRGGTLLKTTDGGYTFTVQREFPSRDIIKISLNGSAGYICTREGEIFRTNDKFNSIASHIISNDGIISAIEVHPSGSGTAVSDEGYLYRTNDNGATWSKSSLPAFPPLSAVQYLDTNRLLIGGHEGFIGISTDNGLTWSSVSQGTGAIKGIAAGAGSAVYAAAVTGEILKSGDDGITWQVVFTAEDVSFRTLSADGSFIFAAGEFGTMLASEDNGSNWLYRSAGSRVRFNKIIFVDANHGWIIGGRGLVLRTTDAGETWNASPTGVAAELYDIHAYKDPLTSEIKLWIVGAHGTSLISTDTGQTFTPGPFNSITSYDLKFIHISKHTSRAGGVGGALFYSADKYGSSPWKRVSGIPATRTFNSYAPLSTRAGILVGDSGYIQRIAYRPFGINAGTNFVDYSWQFPYDFKSVYFLDGALGWVVGQYGIVLRTLNAKSFLEMAVLDATSLNSVHFFNKENGFTVGTAGKVFKSTDSGLSWREIDAGVTHTLYSVFMLNQSTVFIAGATGLLLRTKTGGENPAYADNLVSSVTKNSLSVFPNPFRANAANGNLTFRYELRDIAAFSIDIYDILGRRVAGIAEEKNPSGRGEIYFNPTDADIPSGIYFAVLITPNERVYTKFLYVK
ncbi:MAG: T9SS type A sorting domain-containing protein [Ignavibacteriaceae bacterium]|nr:T9SS type A sorting domain-containing protein [Ignavibacteriaceae bacterium]